MNTSIGFNLDKFCCSSSNGSIILFNTTQSAGNATSVSVLATQGTSLIPSVLQSIALNIHALVIVGMILAGVIAIAIVIHAKYTQPQSLDKKKTKAIPPNTSLLPLYQPITFSLPFQQQYQAAPQSKDDLISNLLKGWWVSSIQDQQLMREHLTSLPIEEIQELKPWELHSLSRALKESRQLHQVEEESDRQIKASERYFDTHLAKTFHRVPCAKDGDCLYWAVGLGLNPQKSPLTVRQELSRYMKENGATLKKEVFTYKVGIAYEEEIDIVSKSAKASGTGVTGWGDMAHAAALARLYKCPVTIHCHTFKQQTVNEDASGTPIHLFYNRVNHWDLLIKRAIPL